MFGTLGGPELFLIFVVALIVFGPRKLPEIGKSLGKMMAEFRKASNEFRSTIESEVEAEKIRDSMRIDLPKLDPFAAPAVSPSQPTVTNQPAGSAEAVPAHEPAPATDPAASGYPDPAAPQAGAPEPAAQPAPKPVPESVSRQADPTPIEPK
jgi:sec-independent protein translocase protein TatB